MSSELERRYEPSTIENIDGAMFSYIKKMELHATTNKGWVPVPFIWVGAERSFQVKNDLRIRDSNSLLILPQITLERISMNKSLSSKGIFWGDKPPVNDERGGVVELTRRINQKKTADFANANSVEQTRGKINFKTSAKREDKIVYEIVTIPTPVYVDIVYKLTIRSEYQAQMNDLLTPFFVDSGGLNHFLIDRNAHRYEAFYQEDYSLSNNVANFDDQERVFKTEVNIKVLGYLVGAGVNDDRPKRVIRENAVDIKVNESIYTGSLDF